MFGRKQKHSEKISAKELDAKRIQEEKKVNEKKKNDKKDRNRKLFLRDIAIFSTLLIRLLTFR